MKIAILYSGSIRTLKETILNNIDTFNYDNVDIDLYFSIWDHVGYSDRINSPDYIFSNRTINNNLFVTEQFIKSIIPNNVNIKRIKIEKYNSFNYSLDLINGVDNNGLSAQYYKILDCFNLLDKSINYDALIRLRCDILFQNKMSKNYLFDMVNNNKIIFTEKIWYNYPFDPKENCINEMIWICNKNNMEKCCNIYNNTNKINDLIIKQNDKNINFGEKITFMNLKAENLVSNIEIFDFNYNILR